MEYFLLVFLKKCYLFLFMLAALFETAVSQDEEPEPCRIEHTFVEIIITLRGDEKLDLNIPDKLRRGSKDAITNWLCEKREDASHKFGDGAFAATSTLGKICYVYVIYAYRFYHQNKLLQIGLPSSLPV